MTAIRQADEIPDEALDRILIAVAHYAEAAKRSQVRRDRVGFRRWVLKRSRQVRFFREWGLS